MNRHFSYLKLLLLLFVTSSVTVAQISETRTIECFLDQISVADSLSHKIRILRTIPMTIQSANPDTLIYCTTLLLKTAENSNDHSQSAILKALIGGYYRMKYEFDTALIYYLQSIDSYRLNNDHQGIATAYINISYILGAQNKLKESEEYLHKCLEVSHQYNYNFGVYHGNYGLSYIYQQYRDYPSAEDYMIKAQKAAVLENDSSLIASTYNDLGNLYYDQALNKLAIENFYAALSMYENISDSIGLALALGNIGMVHIQQKDFARAEEMYLNQVRILTTLNRKYELSIAHKHLGSIYQSMNDIKQAAYHFRQALHLNLFMKFDPGIGSSYYHLASLYQDLNQTDSALYFAKLSLEINERINERNMLPENYILMGNIYSSLGKKQQALPFLHKGYHTSIEYQNPYARVEALKSLSEVYHQLGRNEHAYNYLLMYHQMNDSLKSKEDIKKLTTLELEYEFDKKQRQFEFEKEQEELAFLAEARQQRILIYASIGGIILLLILALFIYRNYITNKKANQEKEALLKEIHHRVKNNLQVISSLLNLQSGYLDDDMTKAVVKEGQSRVKSMALIHQLLYQSEMFSSIDFSAYLQQLVSSLFDAFCPPGKNIKYSIHAENLNLDLDRAIPLGLITNELASNALKYAFIERQEGHLEIGLKQKNDNQIELSIIDNGIGLPGNIDIEASDSLGLKLVKLLTRQIGAELNYTNNDGTQFYITFSMNES